MIRELHDLPAAEREAHEAKNGRYNDFPPKWREIDMATFAKSRHFTFAPVLIEFRQMYDRERTPQLPMLGTHLEWQSDGTGFAVVNDFWAGTVKFFTFGERPADLVEIFDTSD